MLRVQVFHPVPCCFFWTVPRIELNPTHLTSASLNIQNSITCHPSPPLLLSALKKGFGILHTNAKQHFCSLTTIEPPVHFKISLGNTPWGSDVMNSGDAKIRGGREVCRRGWTLLALEMWGTGFSENGCLKSSIKRHSWRPKAPIASEGCNSQVQ